MMADYITCAGQSSETGQGTAEMPNERRRKGESSHPAALRLVVREMAEMSKHNRHVRRIFDAYLHSRASMEEILWEEVQRLLGQQAGSDQGRQTGG